jgi:hypothetical protein
MEGVRALNTGLRIFVERKVAAGMVISDIQSVSAESRQTQDDRPLLTAAQEVSRRST